MSLLRPILLSGALAAATFMAPAMATPPAQAVQAGYRQAADSYAFPLGDITVTALSDGTVPQDLYKLLIGASHDHIDNLLGAAYLANPVEASINAFLIQDGKRMILVDTGSGELFGPGFGGKLPDSLDSLGIKPDEITDILITHIHTDHTGGLVRQGKPVFPNATVHVGAPDAAFFLDPKNAGKTGYDKRYFEEAIKTIGVYDKLGQMKVFGQNDTILPGIVGTIHPGHTPGSAFFKVTSKGQSIVFIGDIVHVAAVQFPDPGVAITYDLKPGAAVSTRKTAFADFADGRQLVAAPHLQFPGVGRVRAEGNGKFSWHPMEYRNRDSKK